MGSVEFDLLLYETETDRLDRQQAALEIAAKPLFDLYMCKLDTDVIKDALETLTGDELRHLTEDLSRGPMRDFAHAGLILSDALERYVFKLAMLEV